MDTHSFSLAELPGRWGLHRGDKWHKVWMGQEVVLQTCKPRQHLMKAATALVLRFFTTAHRYLQQMADMMWWVDVAIWRNQKLADGMAVTVPF
jgi:hypothetical protein